MLWFCPRGRAVALYSCDYLFKVHQENISQVFGWISVYITKKKPQTLKQISHCRPTSPSKLVCLPCFSLPPGQNKAPACQSKLWLLEEPTHEKQAQGFDGWLSIFHWKAYQNSWSSVTPELCASRLPMSREAAGVPRVSRPRQSCGLSLRPGQAGLSPPPACPAPTPGCRGPVLRCSAGGPAALLPARLDLFF